MHNRTLQRAKSKARTRKSQVCAAQLSRRGMFSYFSLFALERRLEGARSASRFRLVERARRATAGGESHSRGHRRLTTSRHFEVRGGVYRERELQLRSRAYARGPVTGALRGQVLFSARSTQFRQAVRAQGRRHADDGDGPEGRQPARKRAAASRPAPLVRLSRRTRRHDGTAAAPASVSPRAASARPLSDWTFASGAHALSSAAAPTSTAPVSRASAK